MIMETLFNRVSLFDIMSEEEKSLISQSLIAERYEMGQTIVQAGEQVSALYLIGSGQARRIKELPTGNLVNLGLLYPGEHFGESGLLHSNVMDMTIRASTEMWIWKLAKEEFNSLLKANPELDVYLNEYIANNTMQTFLLSSTVFSDMGSAALRSLLDKITVHRYSSGTNVFTEGDQGDSFYIVRSGQAEVMKESSGELLNRLGEGDFFGELSLLENSPRKASVRAVGDTTLFRLSKADFKELIDTYPLIKEAIIRITSNYNTSGIKMKTERMDHEIALQQRERSSPEGTAIPFARRVSDWLSHARWRRTPFVLQQSEMDCGPACLSMIGKFYGAALSINEIKSIAATSKSGTTLQGLADTAQALGFEANGKKASLDDLSNIRLPAIAHWKGNHYIVVYRVTRTHVIVADPAIGVEKLTREQFAEFWNGILLELRPTAALKEPGVRRSTLQRYTAYMKPHRRLLSIILLLSVAIQIVSLSLPVFTQKVIDLLLEDGQERMLSMIMLTMVVISLVNGFFSFARQWMVSKTALHIDLSMVEDFYKQILRLPLSFFNSRTVGDFLTRVNENEKIRNLLTTGFVSLTLDLITIIVYGSLMLIYNANLFLIVFAILPLYGVVIGVFSPLMRKNSRKQFQANAESNSATVEVVQHIATVKALTAEKSVFAQLMDKFTKTMELRLKGSLLWVSAETAGDLIRTFGTIAVLYFGSGYVLDGDMSTGELVAFTILLSTVTQAVSYMIQMLNDLMEVRISIERLDDVFQAPLEQAETDNRRGLVQVNGHIAFNNVSFRYEEEGNNVLQNVTLEILPGQTVALVGRSGSGKSTLAHLVMKLFVPASGTIRLDGFDVQSIDVLSLRQTVGVVQQETAIFRGTIRENIAYRMPDASHDEIENAAVLGGAHEFIRSLPLGYDTKIGEGGMRLSGGQSQRIAIARALLGNPSILIFDEATSSLDTESERAIQNNLAAIVKNRTTIIIAHRLNTVRHADRIFVLDRGTVAESGTHEELLQTKGLYYYLVSQQL
ncbi:ATP-binding cassette subfamily B protein [Cohnella lupini]|uniref:ATP-binding cassette subfamily B protein n=2 Tax=Cohnella lupini TaxID=1294267 RepID=A0A3D9I053_9BACL|nr:ATP-binding cassette subfamily B protein [Cohnella lupini]